MTQPRKEQINDQRTYYTRIDSVGVATPIPFGTPDVPGGTVQTIQNTIVEPYYNEFLASTITGAPGGAEQDTPAYFYGNSGPFSPPVSAGSTFTITLPGINSGNPVGITFQPSDVFDIGGTPYITTSQVCNRINAALTAAGVNPTTPVAINNNGQVLLLSANGSGYTSGENAFITVNDLTVGVISALGFSASSNATALGVSSPKRGIVTTLMNATSISAPKPQQGGLVQLLLPDASPAVTQSLVQINVSGLGNLPLYPAGQSIFGGLQQFTNTAGSSKFTVQYQRQGAIPGKVITKGGNFSTLLNTDTFQVTVNTVNPALFGLPGDVSSDPAIQTYTFTVTFSSTPTGAQDVINAVNTAWNGVALANGFPAGTEAGRGGLYGQAPGPWQFINGEDQFWILFNGQDMASKSIQIYPPGFNGVVTWTASDLAAFVNAAISSAGQAAQGSASVGPGGSIQITSNLTTGPISSVQILAGDVFGNEPLLTNNDTHMLDKLGISPGIYSGSMIAKPYGNAITPEDIAFFCPDRTIMDPYNELAGIVISGSGPLASTIMTKLGLGQYGTTTGPLVPGGPGSTTIGLEPVTPPIVHALIPEMMYFGEVPENIETSTHRFLTTDEPTPVQPGGGTGNTGASPLLGLDGKINPNLIHKILDILSVDSLTLGSRQTGYEQGNQIARLITPFSNSPGQGPFTLLWEGTSIAGLTGSNASQIMRLYADYEGGIWLTTNAASIGGVLPYTWTKDTSTQSASAVYISQNTIAGTPKVELLYINALATNPFVFGGSIGSGFNPPIGLDPSGTLGGAVAYLQAGTVAGGGPLFENLIPRLLTAQAPGDITLIWEAPPTVVSAVNVPGIRIYVTTTRQVPAGLGMILWFTINASWSGTAWQKDVTGVEADAVIMWQTSTTPSSLLGNFTIYYQAPADNTPWVDWGTSSTASIQTANFNGPANEVQIGTLVPGFNIPQTNAGRPIPRILAGVDNGTILGLRTLMTQWGISGVAGGGGAQTRVYRGYGFTAFNSGGPGSNDFSMITHNAGWNPTTSMWVQDDSTIGSSMQTWSNVGGSDAARSSGQVAFYTVPEGSGTFVDAVWAETGSFTRVGLQLPFSSDPNNALAIPNIAAPASLVKAWVNFEYAGNGTTSPTIMVLDSWNCTVSTELIFGVPVPFITFNAGMTNINYAVVTNIQVLDQALSEVGPGSVSYSQGIGSFAMIVADHTNTAMNWTTSNAFGQFSLVVLGRQ